MKNIFVLFNILLISINVSASDGYWRELADKEHPFLPGTEIIYNECLGAFEDLFLYSCFVDNGGEGHKGLKPERFIGSLIRKRIEENVLTKECPYLYGAGSEEKKEEFINFCFSYFGDINLRVESGNTVEKWRDLHDRFKKINFYRREVPSEIKPMAHKEDKKGSSPGRKSGKGKKREKGKEDVSDACSNPYAKEFPPSKRRKVDE